jgi:hypothetical protein
MRPRHVEGPDEPVEGDHSRRALPFGLERVVAVPCADVEHSAAPEWWQSQGRELFGQILSRLVPVGHHPVTEVDGMPPGRSRFGQPPFPGDEIVGHCSPRSHAAG